MILSLSIAIFLSLTICLTDSLTGITGIALPFNSAVLKASEAKEYVKDQTTKKNEKGETIVSLEKSIKFAAKLPFKIMWLEMKGAWEIIKLTSKGIIPHFKPEGKMIYFERTQLEKWLLRNPIYHLENE